MMDVDCWVNSRFVNNTSAMKSWRSDCCFNADVMMDSVAFIMNHCIQGDGGGLYV